MAINDIKIEFPKTDPNVFTNYRAPLFTKDQLNEIFGVTRNQEKTESKTQEEEYIWVEGYKGTDKNMCCRGYKYELNKKFDMPDGEKIDLCSSGFHLCPELKQVFSYYTPTSGNRFFKVHALIPRSQTKNGVYLVHPDKYAAKSIVFMSECTPREIFNAMCDEEEIAKFSDAELKEAIETSFYAVKKRKRVGELVELGYAEELAKLIINCDREELAKALVKQTNITWDARITALVMSFVRKH